MVDVHALIPHLLDTGQKMRSALLRLKPWLIAERSARRHRNDSNVAPIGCLQMIPGASKHDSFELLMRQINDPAAFM